MRSALVITRLAALLSTALLGVACPALLGDDGGADDGGTAGRPGGGDDECEEDDDCDEDEECDDGECVDAEGGGSEGGIEGDPPPDPEGPRFLSFDSNLTTIDPSDQLIITAVLTDPDGVDDIIGGTLYHGATSQSYGAFVTSASEGSYEIRIGWQDINEIAAIDFEGASTTRALRARFFDQAGHEAIQTVTITLSCGGTTSCGGECAAVRCGASCVAEFYYDAHCGDCDTACTGESTCTPDFDAGGNGWQTAYCSCGAGGGDYAMCGDVCTDISTLQDCGGCDRSCSGDTCRASVADTYDVLPDNARCSCENGFDCPLGESCVCGEESWCDDNVCASTSFALTGARSGYAEATIAGVTYNLWPGTEEAAAVLCSSPTHATVDYISAPSVSVCFRLNCASGATSTDHCTLDVQSGCTELAYVDCDGSDVVDPDPTDDLGCAEASANDGPTVFTGTTSGADNDVSEGCNGGAETLIEWTAVAAGTYSLVLTAAHDEVLAVADQCGVSFLCNDDDPNMSSQSRLDVTAEAGETFIIAASGYNAATGSYTLTITNLGD